MLSRRVCCQFPKTRSRKQLSELVIGNILVKKDTINGKQVITRSDPVPVEINGVVSQRIDLSVMHDEAETILHQIRPCLYVMTLMCLYYCAILTVMVQLKGR